MVESVKKQLGCLAGSDRNDRQYVGLFHLSMGLATYS